MNSGNAGGNAQKQEVSVGTRRGFVDQTKEDGIRKELYENEKKAQKNWSQKWGFYQNSKKLLEDEAVKRGLSVDVFDETNTKKKVLPHLEIRNTKVPLQPSGGVPIKSSGMIGWRSSSINNNLERISGPFYVSRRFTIDPPFSQKEFDERNQKIIFLG